MNSEDQKTSETNQEYGGETGKKAYGYPKELRIRKSVEFDRVYQGNVYAADQVLVVQAQPNQLEHCRLGLSVSRKVGNAVCRNRWKRLLREAFRLNQHKFISPVDIVVRPRKGAVPEFASINRSLIRLYHQVCKRLNQVGTANG